MAVVYDARLGGHAVTMIGMESRPLPRHGMTPADGPAPVVGGHAVPAVVEEGGPGDQRGERLPAGRGAGQPLGLRRLAGVAASAAARVRRRDRPGDRQLRRAVRAVRRVPLPRRRVRRVLGHAQRRHGGPRRRGIVRLGDRRRAGGGGRVHPRGRRADAGRRAGAGAGGRGWPSAGEDEVGFRQAELRAVRQAVRTEKLGEVAAEFDAIHSVQRAKDVGSVHRIIAAADLRPELIAAVERGMARIEAVAT